MDRRRPEDVQPEDSDPVGSDRERSTGPQLSGRAGSDVERDATVDGAGERPAATDDPDAIPSDEL
jgi:hypothetical protein